MNWYKFAKSNSLKKDIFLIYENFVRYIKERKYKFPKCLGYIDISKDKSIYFFAQNNGEVIKEKDNVYLNINKIPRDKKSFYNKIKSVI